MKLRESLTCKKSPNYEPKQGEPYGEELILDLHNCDITKFTRPDIERFCTALCELIDMEPCELHFWDDLGVPNKEQQTHPKTSGTSAVQFIPDEYNSDTYARLDEICLCEHLFVQEIRHRRGGDKFTAKWFGAADWTSHVVTRR